MEEPRAAGAAGDVDVGGVDIGEDVRRGLIDRDGAGVRPGGGLLAGVDLQRLEMGLAVRRESHVASLVVGSKSAS